MPTNEKLKAETHNVLASLISYADKPAVMHENFPK